LKAIVYENYGPPDGLQLREVEKPVPTQDELLIKIVAVSLNGSDREGLRGRPLYARMNGLWKPRQQILGSDIAGYVEAVGSQNREFKPGDAVFGELPGYHGGLAEYACTTGKTLALKPPSLSFAEAAAIPQAGVIALQGIRDQGQVQPGQKVLINGAGGSAGSFAIQLAKLLGAHVTAVDNTHKLDFMRSLGADHVIDYTQEDFTRQGQQYDLILDAIAHRSPAAYQRALRPQGTYYCVGGSVAVLLQVLLAGPWISRTAGKNVHVLAVPQNRPDLLAITELCTSGQIVPVIDRQFPLRETRQAFQYLDDGLAKGKVVISVADVGTTAVGGHVDEEQL
jgi:NADPH:quinone reductase-like Zn-dependent oxidoreductase